VRECVLFVFVHLCGDCFLWDGRIFFFNFNSVEGVCFWFFQDLKFDEGNLQRYDTRGGLETFVSFSSFFGFFQRKT